MFKYKREGLNCCVFQNILINEYPTFEWWFQLIQSGWLNSCIDGSSGNVKKFTKPFKYNCKKIIYICFNIF
jgi:hypothetical protein